MILKKLAAAVLTAGLLLSCHTPSQALVRERPEPDLVFYRVKAEDTFKGELELPEGKTKVDSVEVKAGESPAFAVSAFDDTSLAFEDLYRSVSQTLVLTREAEEDGEKGAEEEITACLAVYDKVSLEPETGGATLTVTDGKTGTPIPGAAYSLYREGKRQKDFTTNAQGEIILQNLAPGLYELRPGAAPAGYLGAEAPVSFEIPSLSLSGGESRVRTSRGKKYLAEDNEIFLAGAFSPDMELAGLGEENIQSITITFENFGAALGKEGRKTVKSFVTTREAEKYLNYRKAQGEICGPVRISYTLKEECLTLTQKLEAKAAPAPTPAPTPRPAATPVPTPRPVQPTQRPGQSQVHNTYKGNATQTAAPVSTPAPSVNHITTPNPADLQNLTIACTSNTDRREGFVFEVTGAGADSAAFQKEYKTDSQGLIRANVPAGLYTIAPKDCLSNKGFALPEPQTAQVAAAGNAYFSFSFLSSERDLTLTVVDNEGLPLEGVLVGIFDPALLEEAPPDARPDSHAVDISQEISEIQEQEAFEALLANPFEKKNALRTAYTDSEGRAVIKSAPTTALLAVPMDTPQGYTMEAEATELPEGTGTEFSVLCEYIEVFLSILNSGTGQPVMGVEAQLLDSAGKELAAWVTDGEAKPFIRVPAGVYSLRLAFDGMEITESYTVERVPTKQEIEIKTPIRGIVPEEDIPEDTPWYHTTWAVCAYILLGGAALGTGGYYLYSWIRKRRGGIA